MSELKAVSTDGAPAALGPYSQAIISGDLVFTAGQIALDPTTGKLVDGGIAAEAERVLENLSAVLQAAGCSMAHVVKTTVYLADLGDYAAVNKVYGRYFSEPYPARSAVQMAGLPSGARLEIDAIARLALALSGPRSDFLATSSGYRVLPRLKHTARCRELRVCPGRRRNAHSSDKRHAAAPQPAYSLTLGHWHNPCAIALRQSAKLFTSDAQQSS